MHVTLVNDEQGRWSPPIEKTPLSCAPTQCSKADGTLSYRMATTVIEGTRLREIYFW